jgi:hypothetical protein
MTDSGPDGQSLLESSGYRWLLGAVCFTVVACLVVAGSTFFIYLISEQGGRFIGSRRMRSVLALAAFGGVIALPAYLLVRYTTGDDR